jgi:hypothetical protein
MSMSAKDVEALTWNADLPDGSRPHCEPSYSRRSTPFYNEFAMAQDADQRTLGAMVPVVPWKRACRSHQLQ